MTTVGTVVHRRKPQLVTLDTIPAKEMTWLWYPYFPIGTVSAIYGRGGIGKSFLTCAIATELSLGRPLPGQTGKKTPQKVLMLSAEDDYPTVLVPRLQHLGADLTKIAVPDMQFTLDPWGVDRISEMMREFAATVVFIDPIVYYAGGKMDMNRSNEVRAMMERLKSAATESESAVIVVGHVRKSQEGAEQDLMMGSADWINAARSGILVTKSNTGEKVMRHAKTNYSARGDSREFTIDNTGLVWGESYPYEDASPASGRPPEQRQKAITFLIATLKNGPVPAADIAALAADEGISSATLTRAKAGLAESYYSKGAMCMVWRLIAQGRGND